MKKNRIAYCFLVVAAIVAFTVVGAKDVSASFSGTVGFNGKATPIGGTDLSTATGLDFDFAYVVSSTGNLDVFPRYAQLCFKPR